MALVLEDDLSVNGCRQGHEGLLDDGATKPLLLRWVQGGVAEGVGDGDRRDDAVGANRQRDGRDRADVHHGQAGALDFLNKHRVLGKVRDLVHEEGKAGLITLHDPNFAMEYCDRILLLKNGTIIGEIDRRNAGREEILGKLSGLYGDIILYENGDSYLMGKRPGTE